MHARSLIVVVVSVMAGALGGAALRADVSAQPATQPAPSDVCGQASAAQLRTTLYFGTSRPKGAVSELEWQVFLRDEVTSRFPDGLTAWDALGQWRAPGSTIEQERAKVLLIVHADDDKARKSVMDVIAFYRKAFEQESVLWETARVCVSS